jgi:hypothetical protein
MGHPSLNDNPAYFGHFANDGAGHIALQSKVGDCGGIEEIISSYVSESLQLSNARHEPISGGLHLGTVATKDIKNGEEVLVTYGPGKSPKVLISLIALLKTLTILFRFRLLDGVSRLTFTYTND